VFTGCIWKSAILRQRLLREAGWQGRHNVAGRLNRGGFHSAVKAPIRCERITIYRHVAREIYILLQKEMFTYAFLQVVKTSLEVYNTFL